MQTHVTPEVGPEGDELSHENSSLFDSVGPTLRKTDALLRELKVFGISLDGTATFCCFSRQCLNGLKSLKN